MIYQVMSVYDRAAMAFGRPVFSMSVGQAVRSFQDECNRNDPQNEMFRHAKDFDLYHLGIFEDGSAEFELFGEPKAVAHGGQMQMELKSDC